MSGEIKEGQPYCSVSGDSMDSFKEQFRLTLEKLTTLRSLGFVLASLALTFTMYLFSHIISGYIAGMGYDVQISIDMILMEFIPLLMIIVAAVVAAEKEKILDLSGTYAIAGRYLGAVSVSTVLMIPVYIMILIAQTIHGTGNQISALQSFVLMVAFTAIVVAVTMLINTLSKHAALFSILTLFIIVPLLVFIISSLTGFVDINTMCSVIPIPDVVAAVNANGNGGLTMIGGMSLVKATSMISVDAGASLVLFLGWAFALFSIVVFVLGRREPE